MSVNLICKLTTKTQNMNGGGGGVPELTPMDVALGMATVLTQFENRYVRALILQSEAWHPESELAIDAWMWATDISIAQGWSVPRGSYLVRKLSYLALDLRINPAASRCPHCGGTGIRRTKKAAGGWRACRGCEGERVDKLSGATIGNGRRRFSDVERAAALGVSDKTFKATWGPRLWLLTSKLLEIEYRAGRVRDAIYD